MRAKGIQVIEDYQGRAAAIGTEGRGEGEGWERGRRERKEGEEEEREREGWRE